MEKTKHMEKDELLDIVETMKNMMGADDLLLDLSLALDSDTLQDLLEYIDRMHDLDVF